MGPAHQPFHPPAKRRVALRYIGQRGAGSMDQLFAQILVAAFADSEQLRLAAGGELSGNQTEPGGEIATVVEAFRPTDGGDKGGCDDRADARDGRQPASLFVLLHPTDELSIEGCNSSIEFNPLRASVLDEQNHTWAQTCSVLLVHQYA